MEKGSQEQVLALHPTDYAGTFRYNSQGGDQSCFILVVGAWMEIIRVLEIPCMGQSGISNSIACGTERTYTPYENFLDVPKRRFPVIGNCL